MLGVTLVGESLNDILNPLLRTRGADTTSADEAEITHEFEELTGDIEPSVEVRNAEANAEKRVAALSLTDLAVTFRTDAGQIHAVNGISFDVAPGEVVAVVGESGSGKSVSSRAVLGLLPSTAAVTGSARLGDRELLGMSNNDIRPIRGDQVSMVFQEPSTALNPVYTVGWQIIEGIQAHKDVSKKDARKRAIELLEMVGMPDPEHRVDYYPHQLSGGQKQRVVIAMAIACDPDVIIADEPTTALDVTVQAAILELLLSLRDRLGTAIVLITHNMGVVADMADRVVVMYRGNIVEQAPAGQLFAEPKHPYTRALLDAVPHLGRENGPGLVDENDARAQGRGPGRRVPRRSGSAGLPRGRPRVARDPQGRGARPRRRVRLGQVDCRAYDRGAPAADERHDPRLGQQDLRTLGPPAAAVPLPLRVRVPGPGVVAQPAYVDRPVRRRAAARPDRPEAVGDRRQGAVAPRQRRAAAARTSSGSRTSCRVASASASASPAPWPSTPTC